MSFISVIHEHFGRYFREHITEHVYRDTERASIVSLTFRYRLLHIEILQKDAEHFETAMLCKHQPQTSVQYVKAKNMAKIDNPISSPSRQRHKTARQYIYFT